VFYNFGQYELPRDALETIETFFMLGYNEHNLHDQSLTKLRSAQYAMRASVNMLFDRSNEYAGTESATAIAAMIDTAKRYSHATCALIVSFQTADLTKPSSVPWVRTFKTAWRCPRFLLILGRRDSMDFMSGLSGVEASEDDTSSAAPDWFLKAVKHPKTSHKVECEGKTCHYLLWQGQAVTKKSRTIVLVHG